jgi:hypothetical protein
MREVAKRLILLRRTRRLASIVTLVWCVGAFASLPLPAQEQERQPGEQGGQRQGGPPPAASRVRRQTAGAPQDRADELSSPWIDWLWSNGPADWALVLTGFVTALLALRTLTAIQKQVDANVIAADAAKFNAETAATHLLAATSPRLYLDGVRVVNFEPEQEPVFFLIIANAGPVQAENVRVFIEVTHNGGGTRPTGDGNTILVPANGRREYDFRASFILPKRMVEVNGWNLTVRGSVSLGDESISYCYKYNQWSGPRPDGVPIFVPCDYDVRRTVSVAITGVVGHGSVGKLKPTKDDVQEARENSAKSQS